MTVFIKHEGDLQSAARLIKKELNLTDGELRYGLNIGGGEYYKFSSLGMKICVISNKGEVEDKEKSEYPFYIEFFDWSGDFITLKERIDFSNLFGRHLAHVLIEKGIQAEAELDVYKGEMKKE
jgi:hypothetical protein